MSSAVGLKTCAIIAGIKKYKSIVKKKKKKHYKILFLVKSKLNRAEQILVMVDLFYKQYARRICRNERINKKFRYIYKTMLLYCLECRKNTESKNPKVARSINRRVMFSTKCTLVIVKN